MDKLEIFKKISEDDKIRISSIEISGEYSVDIVEYDGEKKYDNKIVAFDVFESHNPRIIIKQDRLYLEVNVPDHPDGWTDYIPIDKLDFVNRQD